MNIRQLRIFKEVAQTENMTEAAKSLYLSQPAVSQTIHELEEELNVPLFDRQGRSIKLNAVGQIFLRRAYSFLEEYEELETFAEGIKNLPLKIGSTITIANQCLPRITGIYQAENHAAEITVDTAEKILLALANHEIDLALVEGVINHQLFDTTVFGSYEMCIIVSANHPYAKRNTLTIQEFLEQPLLLRDKGSAIRQTLDSWLLFHQEQAQPFLTSINSQAILESVRANLGITVLPKLLLEKCSRKEEFHSLSFKEGILKNNMQFVTNKGQQKTPRIQSFYAVVTAENK
ncbi:LysR family transcriptional regulator [Enterococcus sp. BWR-S5]|uniref:LysR family transcriptional regulator n=1 Tax=Enterococcus sp. BWR-S5 TaxID=2787714 RepID=UPI0019222A4C|nr:LysR family transcriptional regulator [Enterococcus sp. BWR-S5]MBL1227292.1 LysR family transcriptional regulator [Enterococcus sp. BWR-S5]